MTRHHDTPAGRSRSPLLCCPRRFPYFFYIRLLTSSVNLIRFLPHLIFPSTVLSRIVVTIPFPVFLPLYNRIRKCSVFLYSVQNISTLLISQFYLFHSFLHPHIKSLAFILLSLPQSPRLTSVQ